jgi:lipopolysaccharide export system permease protein
MIYSNLLSVSHAWIAGGKLRFEIGIWAVHVAMLLILIILFHRRQNPLAWGRLRWQ